MELQMLVKIMITIVLLGITSLVIHVLDILLLKPKRLQSKLRKQGISGPRPSFLLGNIPDMKRIAKSKISMEAPSKEQVIVHNCSSNFFPYLDQWREEYGPIFMFSLGNRQILYVHKPDVVRELSICTSLDLGKPTYLNRELKPFLGQGLISSNGAKWAHQRKIMAPEFTLEKVKGMVNIVVDCSLAIVSSWNSRIEQSDGGVADIRVDNYMRSFAGDVISRACFGSNYLKGKEIFLNLRALQKSMRKSLAIGVPGIRYLPTKSNRETWRLEKEVGSQIIKFVKERNNSTSKDLLQMILDGATNSDLGQAAADTFIVDNCKNIYVAGHMTAAMASTWSMMLLASNPEWQDRLRTEVFQVCAGKLPDADSIRQMKILTMVIQESIRLYPPTAVVSREALQDMKFGNIHVPKGVNVWIPMVTIHQDPEIWGPDAHAFNPGRFAYGASGACKFPQMYMPFGIGPRNCLGQNLAMTELRILLAIIISNFSFSVSPKYRHFPTLRLSLEPEHGVNLLIRKL